MYTIYGIPNCDKIKKLIKEADSKNLEYTFVDFKKNAPSVDKMLVWKNKLGSLPVNNRSRVFKEFKEDFENAEEAIKIELLQKNTSAIIRPIIEKDGELINTGAKNISEFL